MNFKYLVAIFVLLNVTDIQAQTKPKPKTSTQPAKPSRETTINYLNEKISQYAIPYEKVIVIIGTTVYYDGSKTEYRKTSRFKVSNYRLEFNSDSSKLYLTATCTLRKTEDDWGDKPLKDKTISWFVRAPFEKVNEISIYEPYLETNYDRKYNDGSKEDKHSSFTTNFLAFEFPSKCVAQIDNTGTDYSDEYQLAFRLGEENLMSKVKKAFLNLLTYYPNISKDPFGN